MQRSKRHRLFFWMAYLPLGLSGIPATIWALFGWLIEGFDRPGQPMPAWAVGAMFVLQLAGIVALAVMPFVRGAFATRELATVFPEGLNQWRNLCLFLGIASLTMFDLLASLGSAIPDAEFLWLGAAPFYLAYLLFVLFVRLMLWR